MTPMDRYDRISSLFLMAISLIIIGGSLTYSVGTWSKRGPAFLPLWCGIIMVFFLQGFSSNLNGEEKEGKAQGSREKSSLFLPNGGPNCWRRWRSRIPTTSFWKSWDISFARSVSCFFSSEWLKQRGGEPCFWRPSLLPRLLLPSLNYG